jgi:hypothetical protein
MLLIIQKLLLSIMIVLISISSIQAATADYALYRVGTEVIMGTDYPKRLKNLHTFACMKSNSRLMKAFKLNKKLIKQHGNEQIDEGFIQRLIRIEKLVYYVNQQAPALAKSVVNQYVSARCLKTKWRDWSPFLKGLVRSEVYLRQRFDVAQKNLGTAEKRRVRESAKLFLMTLEKKIEHFLFKR